MSLTTSPESNCVVDVLGIDVDELIPTHWYNLSADFPEPMPPHLHPGTREPVVVDDLLGLFPKPLAEQELSTERYIEIPQQIREIYASYRPAPLHRAVRLERVLGTRTRIYYKYEGGSPAGSHKPNTSVAQAYYNKICGINRLTTETGAGQWGASLAFACSMLGMECEVWQVRASYEQKPYRRGQMYVYGSNCYSSPSDRTEAGRKLRQQFPDTTGSLGMAISEAVEAAVTQEGTNYALGSVLNHVMLHQTVIGLEAITQMERLGEDQPDVVFGCAGGGSNLAGLAFPFIGRNLREGTTTRVVAVEPEACPSLTQGKYDYDFGDASGLTPLLKMYTLGHDFVPSPIHAGGLRYHGMSPMVSHAYHLGLMDAIALPQDDVFKAGIQFARAEGIIPAPESCHAIAGALKYVAEENRDEAILIGVSGNGVLDLSSYEQFLDHNV